jgi:hypothetical protein
MEYSKLASGQLTVTSTGLPQMVGLPFVPDYIEISNSTRAVAASGVTRAWWETDMGQGAAFVVTTGAGPADGTSYITAATGGGFSTFTANSPALGAQLAISGITKASAAVVTTTGAHGLATGNVVILTGLFQSSTTGMPQISNMPFVITVTGSTTFTIPYNTNQSNFTALSGSPAGAYVRQVLYPYLYFPGMNVITSITRGTTTIVTTSCNHNLVVGSQVDFYIVSPWGTVELTTPNSLGQYVSGYVTAVNSATSVTVGINSSAMSAFNSNPTVAQALAGLTLPQMLTIGDGNTGAVTNTYLPTTINSTTIGGAFQTNTRQGFVIGGSVIGTAADTIYWRAYAHDLSL